MVYVLNDATPALYEILRRIIANWPEVPEGILRLRLSFTPRQESLK